MKKLMLLAAMILMICLPALVMALELEPDVLGHIFTTADGACQVSFYTAPVGQNPQQRETGPALLECGDAAAIEMRYIYNAPILDVSSDYFTDVFRFVYARGSLIQILPGSLELIR